MRAALYIRVSTDEQVSEGHSIQAQKNQLIRYCETFDYQIVEVYIDDGYSAKDTNRPQLKQMLSELDNFDAIIVYKLDRFTRSVRDLYDMLEHLRNNNIEFISTQEKFDTSTAIGRAFLGFLGILAQFERDLVSERVRFVMEQLVLSGKRPGGPVPFGYMPDGVTINEKEAELVREVRRLYMSGEGFRRIATIMNKNPENYRRGKEWTNYSVWYTLDSPYYAGKIRWGTKNEKGKYTTRKKEDRVDCIIVDGPQEKIFTEEEYEEHISRMKQRSFKGYNRVEQYWFTGVLKCGKCGAKMTGRFHKNKRQDGSYYKTISYICANRQVGSTCTMPMFKQELVEHLIMEYIEQIKADQDKIKEMSLQEKSEKNKLNKKLKSLKSELSKIRERKKKWQRMFVDELITEEELKDHNKDERENEEIIQAQINELQQEEQTMDIDTMKMLFDLPEMWDVLDDQEKNELIRTLFNEIELYTPLEKAIGRKGKFIPASITSVEFN